MYHLDQSLPQLIRLGSSLRIEVIALHDIKCQVKGSFLRERGRLYMWYYSLFFIPFYVGPLISLIYNIDLLDYSILCSM